MRPVGGRGAPQRGDGERELGDLVAAAHAAAQVVERGVRARPALAPIDEVHERREVPPAGGAAHGPAARAPDHGPASDGFGCREPGVAPRAAEAAVGARAGRAGRAARSGGGS